MKTKGIIGLIFGLIVLIFALQNVEVTKVKFLFWEFSASRILIIISTFFTGMLVGYLFSTIKKRRY